MNSLDSFFLLILAGCLAYVFTIIFGYFERCRLYYGLKKMNKNQIMKKKCQKIYSEFKDHYYTVAVNNPYALAQEIARAHLQNIKRNGLVNEIYSKMKASKCV